MSGFLKMLARVFAPRLIVATNMTTGQTNPNALPAVAGLHTFLTPQRLAFCIFVDHVEMFASHKTPDAGYWMLDTG
jgi:hypothetical protein